MAVPEPDLDRELSMIAEAILGQSLLGLITVLVGAIAGMMLHNSKQLGKLATEIAHIREWQQSFSSSVWANGEGVDRWMKTHEQQMRSIIHRIEGLEADRRHEVRRRDDRAE